MKKRLESLDIFRGITIAFMIIVNTPGDGRTAFGLLQHADWNGFTPTDLVFPSFVFITGLSSWFSYKTYNHTLTSDLAVKIWKRALIIFLLGVGLYAFPFVGHPLSTWRILGVLQRIALCYGIGSMLCLVLNTKQIIGISVLLLMGYWGIMSAFGDLTMAGNAGQKLDLFLFGDSHLYHGEGVAFDPEGLLSTMPALVTFLIGYLVGGFIGQNSDKQQIIKQLSIAGIALVIGGLIWNFDFPINKKLWTSSYVLFAGGLSTLIFTLCYYLIDVKGINNWTKFFKIFGTNAILAYMISELLVICLQLMETKNAASEAINGQEAIFDALFASWLGRNEVASLAFSLAYTFACWVIVWLFYRKNVFLKV
jgi:predicted acyltransferase